VNVARGAGVPVIEIEIVCSNLDAHRQRIETRTSDLLGFRLPTWQQVVAHDYRPWHRDRMIVDTAGVTVADAVNLVRDALRSVQFPRKPPPR
jgi:hypothetical protein